MKKRKKPRLSDAERQRRSELMKSVNAKRLAAQAISAIEEAEAVEAGYIPVREPIGSVAGMAGPSDWMRASEIEPADAKPSSFDVARYFRLKTYAAKKKAGTLPRQ